MFLGKWHEWQLWHIKTAFFPIPACFLRRFQETAAFFVSKIINSVPQDRNRQAPFEAAFDFVPAESGYEPLDNFSLKQREENHLSFFHQGKKGFVFDVAP